MNKEKLEKIKKRISDNTINPDAHYIKFGIIQARNDLYDVVLIIDNLIKACEALDHISNHSDGCYEFVALKALKEIGWDND